MGRLRLGILASGRGSNLQALIDACADPAFPAEIALVLSNRPGAQAIARAQAVGLGTGIVPHEAFADRESHERAIDAALAGAGVELTCLAGYMRLLTPWFVERWRDRLLNIHPSLLPAFKGLDTHARALAAGVRFHGCTVHFVRPEMDEGPILAQAAVPVVPGDDAERLAARVLAAEHRIYPLAVRLIAEGRARVAGERVAIEAPAPAPEGLLNPAA
ncbi:phosphoribosylglycinamide formyltransferase [Arenibaculum pallidiluteum]|uniref:phosphoribosylglycinamide formyltransferase n=1 Tax=Arenibaculum pallidiluteum TaxID=2812559 RepID=UPI001A95E220|nr:phosphoribosylglycinamide formyltransferase [Arenibaculum pallidiluteum]